VLAEQVPGHRVRRDRVSARRTANEYGISDEVTGKCVGTVSIEQAPRIDHQRCPIRAIRLFDSEHISSFNPRMECVAFVKGVEAVLNYMLEAKDVKGLNSALNHMLDVKGCDTPAKPAA
jgi:hypothetical protein